MVKKFGELKGFQISQEMLGEFKYFLVSLSSCQPFQYCNWFWVGLIMILNHSQGVCVCEFVVGRVGKRLHLRLPKQWLASGRNTFNMRIHPKITDMEIVRLKPWSVLAGQMLFKSSSWKSQVWMVRPLRSFFSWCSSLVVLVPTCNLGPNVDGGKVKGEREN